MADQPTPIQRQVYDFIAESVDKQGIAPTNREIADRFGWKSPRAPAVHIEALIRKGWLERRRGTARGLRPVRLKTTPQEALRRVPLVGTVVAGIPVEAIEDVEGMVGIDPAMFPDAGVFALRVKGDSMTGVGINNGDVALVRQADTAEDGDLVVAVVDGEATLKRFLRRDGDLVLHPENPAYRDIVIPRDADLHLSGVVVGIIRKL